MRDADRALLTFLSKHGRIERWVRQAVEEMMQAQNLSAIEALCDGGFVEQDAIAEVFESVLGLQRVQLRGASPRLPRPLDGHLLRTHLVLPAEVSERRLTLAMANPLDDEAIRKVRFACGMRVVPAVGSLTEIRGKLLSCEMMARSEALAADEEIIEEPSEAQEPTLTAAEIRAASTSPIVRMATAILEQGISSGASDIHLEPDAAGIGVRYRIDGILEEATRLSRSVQGTLITRLKVMAALDIAERRRPQDGRIQFRTGGGRALDCRVSSLPTQYGEKIVIRVLDPERSLVDLDKLGFEPAELTAVDEALHRSEGLLLTTGPTGSGKSTTLYSMLRAIQTPAVNIMTVENPIEYRLPGITQTEVNTRQGLTFGSVLRSVLRQDPDVILVGEIRDEETAEIAIQAAQTGHLVLSTLHTNDAVGAVTRLANLGIDRELIASAVLLVIAQRLVRAVCNTCSEAAPPEAWQGSSLRAAVGEAELVRGRGCSNCRNSGYRGRLGIYEVFRNTIETKRLIKEGASEVNLRDQMRRQGGRALMAVALEKIRIGRTTIDEVSRVIQPEEGIGQCPECGQRVEKAFRSCPHCGVRLQRECPTCGGLIRDDWDACAHCGAAVIRASAGTQPEAVETQVVTFTAPTGLTTPSVMGAAARAVCMVGGLDAESAAELDIAVVEACNLACAVESNAAAEISVRVEMTRDGCGVCVSGEGAPWPWPRPSARLPDLDMVEAESPAVRAFLIRSSAEEVTYERSGQSNRLWFTKRRRTSDAAEAAGAAPRLSA